MSPLSRRGRAGKPGRGVRVCDDLRTGEVGFFTKTL